MERKLWIMAIAIAALMLGPGAPVWAHNTKPPCCCGQSSQSSGGSSGSGSGSGGSNTDTTCKDTTGKAVELYTGSELYYADGPSLGQWSLNLTYSSLTNEWRTASEMYAVPPPISSTTRIIIYMDAHTCLDFHKVDTSWLIYGEKGEAENQPYHLEEWDLTGTDDAIALYHEMDHVRKMYIFHHPQNSAGDNPGKLWKVGFGVSKDYYYTQLTYNYTSGILSTMEDDLGRVTHFQFNSDKLTKVIESNVGGSTPLDNTNGRVTWLEWDATGQNAMITRMSIGMPKRIDANAGSSGTVAPTEGDYYWRRTAFEYVEVAGLKKLAYVIKPDQYDEWAASTQPDKSERYAANKLTYYTSGENVGKVKSETSNCNTCSGTGGGREIVYYSTPPNQLYSGSQPAAPNTPYVQRNIYELSGDNALLTAIYQMNDNEQTVFLLRRATDTTGWLTQYRYNNASWRYSLEYVTEYSVSFDWLAGTGNATNHTKIAEEQYTYNGYYQLITKAVWDGTTNVTVTESTYKDTTSKRLETVVQHLDGSTSLTTTYKYDTDANYNRLIAVCNPQVTSGQNPPSGTAYYTGKRTTYDTKNRVSEVKILQLSDTPANWPDTGSTTLRSTKYVYTDDAGGLGDTNRFELYQKIEDYGDASHLNLTTQYDYTAVCGVWRKTRETLDPGTTNHVNLETTYDYTTVDPESGAWGNPTTVTEPETAYRTAYYYDKSDRILSADRTCNGHTLSKVTRIYSKDGALLCETNGADSPVATSTVYEYDKAGRKTALYEDVASLDFSRSAARSAFGSRFRLVL